MGGVMSIIYKNEVESVTLRLYVSGVLTDASSDPTLTVKTRAGDFVASPDVLQDSEGVYSAIIGPSITDVSTDLVLTWEYDLAGETVVRNERMTVVQPYLSVSELTSLAPTETEYDMLKAAEAYARHQIDSFCGQHFYPYNDTVFARGQGDNILTLTQRVVRVDRINVNDVVVYDATDVNVNDFGAAVNISPTSKALIIASEQYLTYDPIHWSAGKFASGTRYDVTGVYGWDYIPDAVNQAAMLLVNDFFCKESNWRNRFVESISASDWRIVFNDGAFNGTGNSSADSILQPFIAVNWAVV